MIQRDGNTIYKLSARGVNRWYAGIQAGHDDLGNRTTWTELEKIAVKLSAVDELYEALEALLETCHAEPHGESERRAAIAALSKARGEL